MGQLKQANFAYYLDLFLHSILAGLLIGIAGSVYLSLDNKIIGSFLFSFGLMTIIIWGLNLYTGKIGVINLKEDKHKIPLYIVGNYLGTLIVAICLRNTRVGEGLISTATNLAQIKLSDNLISIFILSIFCGIMMYLAVIGYKKHNNPLMVIFPIMIFILTGFEHSIANMFYFNMAWCWNIKSLIYLIVMIIGNGIGSLFIKLLYLKKIW